ncbi:hypothetical protein H1P_150018 [Hyella patelloides LEGE 07179]|uniref:Uncharacterized protein n=1 Tax=Hyella patelloides LEGE 07179 TaxID=945734 RepID=A0A563VLX5_9CYAN|nr:hypothetical protein H1P_150018 [Hyella patelloides LEGE 07179]
MTALDIVRPQQVFSSLPNVEIHRIWKTLDAIATDDGMRLLPDATFGNCPPFNVGSPEKAGLDFVNKAISHAIQTLFQIKEDSLS